LGNAENQFDRRRLNAIYKDRLRPIGKVGSKPRQNSIRNSKTVVKSREKDRMINGIKGSRQIKES
jgi:hypothetical protein